MTRKGEIMKVIDLLNKIANGEEVPNEIIYDGLHYYNVGNKTQAYYENSELDEISFIRAIYSESHLNDEVELLEEDKKIKKIETKIGYGGLTYLKDENFGDGDLGFTKRENIIVDKINEIIEVINER